MCPWGEKIRENLENKAEGETGEQIKYSFGWWQGKGKDEMIREYLGIAWNSSRGVA